MEVKQLSVMNIIKCPYKLSADCEEMDETRRLQELLYPTRTKYHIS